MRPTIQLDVCEMTAAGRLSLSTKIKNKKLLPSYQKWKYILSFFSVWSNLNKNMWQTHSSLCGSRGMCFVCVVQLHSRSSEWLKSHCLLLFGAFFTAAEEKPRWSPLPCKQTRQPQMALGLADFCKWKLTWDGLPISYNWDVTSVPGQHRDIYSFFFPLQ